MATWWRQDLGLKCGPHWTYEQKEVPCFGKMIRKYAATDTRDGKEYLLASVTNVLSEALGAGDQLITWAVKQTQADILAGIVGSETYEEHLDKFHQLSLILEEEAARRKGSNNREFGFSDVLGYLIREFGDAIRPLQMSQLAAILDGSTKARWRTMETAAEYGTRSHELIELWLKNGESFDHERDGELYTIDLAQEPPEVQNCLAAFFKFWKGENLKFLGCEMAVCDVELGVGGTLDVLAEAPDSELILIDWKTSKNVYDKHLLQVAAYARMHEKMGLGKISRAYIVQMNKVTAALQVVPVFENRDEFLDVAKQWGCTVATYHWLKAARKKLSKFEPSESDAPAVPRQAPIPPKVVDDLFRFRGDPAPERYTAESVRAALNSAITSDEYLGWPAG